MHALLPLLFNITSWIASLIMFSIIFWQTQYSYCEAICYKNWPVISQRSCSEALDYLRVQTWFSPSAWRAVRCCVPVCPPGVSIALCCFSSIRLPLTLWTDPAPRLSCQVLLFSETFAVNCLCFLSCFHLPEHYSLSLHFIHLYFCSSLPLLSFPSLSFLHFIPPSSSSLSFVSLWLPRLSTHTPSGLCCGASQKRSGQMVSDDFRALLISTGNSLVLLLAWRSHGVSAGPRIS